MSKDVKIQLNAAGVKELLQSNEMKAMIQEKVELVAKTLGVGHESSVQIGRKRVQGRVSATTSEAIKKNKKENSLLKALNAVR